jgi:transcriptional regulator with XRE-family HTH domain
MTGREIRAKRVFVGVSGAVLCRRAGIGRTRLSAIECGYVEPSAPELSRIRQALEELLTARERLIAAATDVGWPTETL